MDSFSCSKIFALTLRLSELFFTLFEVRVVQLKKSKYISEPVLLYFYLVKEAETVVKLQLKLFLIQVPVPLLE